MSDHLDRFAHGIAENIIHALTSDSDDGFHESCHIDSEEQSKQNLQSDTEETMDGFPSSNMNYVAENVSNAEDSLARNEDSTEMNLSNEKLGNSSKNNTEARHWDRFVPGSNPCHSATYHSERETQKMTTDIPDDVCSKFEETILRSRANSKASSISQSKLEDTHDKELKNEGSNVLNISTIEDEFKYTESVNVLGNLDIIGTRGVKLEAQSLNSFDIVDISSLKAGPNEVPLIENKIPQKHFDAGYVGTSNENFGRDVVQMSETKSSQKGFEVGKYRIEEQTEAITDCDSSLKVGFIEDSTTKKNKTELSTEVINQILKKLNIGNLEEESIPNSASSEELPHNRSSQKHKLKQRRVGTSKMQCSLNELDTSHFDERNSIVFGLPKVDSEIRHRRSKDVSKEQSSERRTINVPNKYEDVSDFVEQPSTSSIKRRNDTQPEEPNVKFRKRCPSSTDAETGEEIESRHHIRFASVGNEKCNTNEGMKGTHVNVQSGSHINVKDFEALDLLQKRKRGPDEGLRTILGEPLSISKKLKKQVESDLLLKEKEFSKEDSS